MIDFLSTRCDGPVSIQRKCCRILFVNKRFDIVLLRGNEKKKVNVRDLKRVVAPCPTNICDSLSMWGKR